MRRRWATSARFPRPGVACSRARGRRDPLGGGARRGRAAGIAETLAALLLAWGERPLVAHDWKAIGGAGPIGEHDGEARPPEQLGHDTMVAAYLIDPARRKYPLDELIEQAGIEAVVEGANGVAEEAVAVSALARVPASEIDELELRGCSRRSSSRWSRCSAGSSGRA